MPKTNVAFWHAKLTKNRERDARNLKRLKELGWEPLVVWECDVKNTRILEKLADQIQRTTRVREG
jgi:DNA mismatch endonuclease (patch repair protein)